MKIQKITQWKSLCTALVCRKINRFIWKNKPKNLNIKTLPDISFRVFFPSFYFFSLPFENHSVSWLQEKWNFQFVIQDDSEWKIYPVTARRGAYIRTNTSHFLQSWRVMSCINSTPLSSLWRRQKKSPQENKMLVHISRHRNPQSVENHNVATCKNQTLQLKLNI